MKCIKCKETYDDDFKFCPYCGEVKPAPKICPNCELEPNVEFSFCPECGTELVSKSQWEELKREELKKEEIRKLNEQIMEYEKLGEYEKALECYDKLIEIDSENSTYWKEKREELREKLREELREELNKLNEQRIEYEKLKRYEEALECYDKLIIIDSENSTYWSGKADCLYILGRYRSAIECYNEAIELNPENYSYRERKGRCLYRLEL